MGRIRTDVSSAFGAVVVDVSGGDQVIVSGCRGLWVGTSGDVVVDMPNATGITFADVVGLLPIQVTKIYQTGTTASDVVALL